MNIIRGIHLKRCFCTKFIPDPKIIKHDYIGPPDPKSNLRPIIRCEVPNEAGIELELRTRRLEIEKWNQNFWTNHNKRFIDGKEEFIAANKLLNNNNEALSADKMSEFYKSFLDKNWKIHLYYNISWYLKNVELLMLSTQVNIKRVYKKIKK